LTKEQQTL